MFKGIELWLYFWFIFVYFSWLFFNSLPWHHYCYVMLLFMSIGFVSHFFMMILIQYLLFNFDILIEICLVKDHKNYLQCRWTAGWGYWTSWTEETSHFSAFFYVFMHYVCLSGCMPAFISVYQLVGLPVCMPGMSVCLPICLFSVWLSVWLFFVLRYSTQIY